LGNNDLLSLTRPDIIKDIHQQYLLAGADIITTNSFNANGISMSDYGMEDVVYEMNLQAARIAREVINEFERSTGSANHFVAGTLGPTNRTASMSSDVNDPGARSVTFDKLVSIYSEQAQGLIDGGADVLLVETVFDVCTRLNKTPVLIKKEIYGFVVNRIFSALTKEACYLLDQDEATIEDIDIAVKNGLGHPMGPFALLDLTGIDLEYNVLMAKYQSSGDLADKPSPTIVEHYARGEFGRKSKKGFYTYK
jgi:hypothetical protein